jgi:hypothetical protein
MAGCCELGSKVTMIMEDEKLVDQQSDDQLLKDCVQ